MSRVTDILCVFRIQLMSMRNEVGPFLLAGLVFPAGMYLFANAVSGSENAHQQNGLRFLGGSIIFSLSLTSISWLGYLLLENRFTGRLKLFATLPLAPSSYICGMLVFAFVQTTLSTVTLLIVGRALGVPTRPTIMLVPVLMLTVLTFCGLGAVIAARARSFTQGSLLTDTLGAGLVFLSPVYYTAETMPSSMRTVSGLLPTTFAARAVQTTLTGGYHVGSELVALGLMALATLFLGFRLTRWREE